MLNYDQEKNNQVCLIEDSKKILWTKNFRRAWSCCVSDNGTIAVKNIDIISIDDVSGSPAKMFLHSIVISPLSGSNLELSFGKRAEIIAFALSPDGRFLIYNLQQYVPNKYELVLHNLETNKEEWRYLYPQDQVIHELIFKEHQILAYAGPRPSAYNDRQYSFSLDLTGNIGNTSNQAELKPISTPRAQPPELQVLNQEKVIPKSINGENQQTKNLDLTDSKDKQVLSRQLAEHKAKLQKNNAKRFFASLAVWLYRILLMHYMLIGQ
jgi:hypothetical protein